MTDVVSEVDSETTPEPEAAAAPVVDDQMIGMLVDRARAEGLQLTGEGGLLQQLTKRVVESALDGEMTGHSRRRSRSDWDKAIAHLHA